MDLYWLKKNKNNFEKDSDEITKKSKISSFLVSTIKNSRNLNFLVGSGCSLPSIPLMSKMIESIKNDEKLKKVVSQYNSGNIENLEEFLNWLNSGISFFKNNANHQEEYLEAFNNCKKIIISIIKKGMLNDKYESTIMNYINFYNEIINIRSLKEKNSLPKDPINIFTTNYDLFNELALEKCKFQYTTGFHGEVNRIFDMNNFRFRLVDSENRYKERWDPYNAYIKIYKIHGSINWIFEEQEIKQINFKNNDDINTIIYPTLNKNNQTLQNPYSQLFREFSIQLQKSHSTLIVIGYGFSDDHINKLISQTLSNENFNLIIFGDVENHNIKNFKEQHIAKSNLHFIGGADSNNDKLFYFSSFISLLEMNNVKQIDDFILGEEKNA